jgi:hypothetical protein
MIDRPISYDFGYVHTDIPEGMTIREWRAQRAVDRAAARLAAGASRRPSVLGGRLTAVVRPHLDARGTPGASSRPSQEARGWCPVRQR